MTLRQLAAAALVVLLVGTASALAAPGNGSAPEQADDDRQGPPVDMPDPVPDFVGAIHEQIWGHVTGGVERLGEAVSDLTPGGADAAGNETGTATPTPA